MSEKSAEALKTIGEVAKELNLIEVETGKAKTYILRFWEKEFPQLKPKLRAKGRRYYTAENVKLLKKIQYLLKDKGLTIKGAKKIIENNINDIEVDDFERKDISTNDLLNKKEKLNRIKKNYYRNKKPFLKWQKKPQLKLD
jgi:DNA-binding transcriptional MerR regulator